MKTSYSVSGLIVLTIIALCVISCRKQPVQVISATTEAIAVDASADGIQDAAYLAQLAPVKADLEDSVLPSPFHPFHKNVLVLRENILGLRYELYLQHLQRNHQGWLHRRATLAAT